jgi:hypothetical protein
MPFPGNILEGHLKSERATPGYKASGWGLECPNMNPHEGNQRGPRGAQNVPERH